MAEGARLEIVCRLQAYRGFKSLSLRQILKDVPMGHLLIFYQLEGFERAEKLSILRILNPPRRESKTNE